MTKSTSAHLNLMLRYNFNVPVDMKQLKAMLKFKVAQQTRPLRSSRARVQRVIQRVLETASKARRGGESLTRQMPQCVRS
jgi:hypothetical protein